MKNNKFKLLGTIFLVASGFLYTTERSISYLSEAIVLKGYATHGTNIDYNPIPIDVNSNYFIWLFLILGSISLIYGIVKDGK